MKPYYFCNFFSDLIWIGLYDRPAATGHFVWVNGMRLDFPAWAPDSPKYYNSTVSCVVLNPQDKSFTNQLCNETFGYVCETYHNGMCYLYYLHD